MSFPNISVEVPFDNFVKSTSFAQQLVALDEYQYDKAMPKAKKGGIEVSETRDVADPMYVSKWLLTFLTDTNSDVVTGSYFPQIMKKIRDDVIFKGGELPYRRSGLWMTMKVALQLNLEKEFGQDIGNCIYKIIQIHLASKMCEFWMRSEYRTIDTGLAVEMLAKLGRKLEKLTTKSENLIDKVQCETLFSIVTSYAKETILRVREKLNDQFNKLNLIDQELAELQPLENMNFESDTIHTIPSLSEHLEIRMKSGNTQHPNLNCMSEPKKIKRHRSKVESIPNFKLTSETSEVKLCLILVDIENWVRANSTKCTIANALRLRTIAIDYGTAAKKHYKDDPLGGSRMILTILQIIRTLDQLATEDYSLFEQHHSGINPKIFEDLLLPSRDQMEVSLDLESYFEQRNSESKFPALNAESEVSHLSFSARFAETNKEMKALRQKILDEEEEKVEEKMEQVNQARLKIQKWREEAKGLNHEFKKIWSNYEFRTAHDSNCRLCWLTKKWTKYRVKVYERALRREDYCQYAVAFELLIPPVISCLRDVLQFAADAFFFTTKSIDELSIKGEWIDYEQISSHKNGWNRRVHLGSTRLLYTKSHYNKRIHPDSDDNEFIVNNGYNCIYHGPNKIELSNKTKKQTVERFCTFQVESNSPYQNLQWTLSGTGHFQNQVLARQNECPIELTLPEFVAFGSLRSDGHRLQIRNIYRALATETLSFEKEAVAALVLQSLWQAGPKSNNHWLRESHEDLCDEVFASEMLGLLTKYLSLQQDNWKHPLKMMIAILIATRILELNENDAIVETAINVLLFCRHICDDWMARIEKAKSQCDCLEVEQIQSLRLNMVDVGICCALTFYASPKLEAFSKLWQSSTTTSALTYWLNAIVNVNNSIDLCAIGNSELSNFRRIFLREMRIIGINSEKILLDQITKDFSTEMNRFAANQWPNVRNGSFKKWKSFLNVPQVVHTEVITREDSTQNNGIQIDVILGTFLVNGLPISSLPEVIKNHNLFIRTFGSTILEVQPTKDGTFCTRLKYNDCTYSFKMEWGQLIIKEVRPNGDILELIPNEAFGEDIPYVLQHEHSHWWNREKQSIDFRPLKFNVNNFSNSDQVKFELDLRTKLLTELKTSRKVIDRLSSSFLQISEYLNRLESEEYIIAIMDGPQNVSIELPRMRIQFKLDESNEIMSHEYIGMQISRDQKFGTFIGLQNGLLLHHKENGEQLVIMPHGKIETKTSNKADLNVWINTNELREPQFFIYDIDNRCQQLKTRGGFSGWFYLAHLHAVTSHPLPDPFTGMRGTEKALQILQSPFCWSSEPYDSESIATLNRIRQLSPARSYHPPHQSVMQKIQWSYNLPSSSLHEAYAMLVDRLIEDSERLKFLHGKDLPADTETHKQKDYFLNKRSYRRYVCLDPNAAVSKHFIDDPDKSADDSISDEEESSSDVWSDCRSNISIFFNNFDSHANNMRIIAALAHKHQFHIPSNYEDRLRNLLFSKENLQGLSNNITGSDLIMDLNCDLSDIWLDIYDIASNKKFDEVKLTMMLTLLAFNGNDLSDLLILQVVAANPMKFCTIKPPAVQQFTNIMEDDFNKSRVAQIVSSCAMTKETYLSQFGEQLKKATDYEKELLKHTLEWNTKTRAQAHAITERIEKQWPCIEVDISAIYAPQMYGNEIIHHINPLLQNWYQNRQLKLFLSQVNNTLHKLTDQSAELENLEKLVYGVHQEDYYPKYKINFEEKIARNFNKNTKASEIKTAMRLFNEGKCNDEEEDANNWWERVKQLSLPDEYDYLEAANIFPRLVPTLVLPQMISSSNENQKNMIGALGVLFSLDQRAVRLKKLEQQQPQMEVALRREKEENPFCNWLPCIYPQWLLFEIEMNLTIRRIQIEVAKKMIQPLNGMHSVMQLNMGEGKTAVIVPLLCAILSNERQVCQVTVLKSLLKSNLKSLRQCLGGMLNRRIFTFPCRRDMIIDENEADLLLKSYKKCMQLNGVIMTLPEYRLSLQLKMYETARKGEFELANILFQTHDWLNEYARNILDESDAILNPKYQLIYTVGEQLPLDGGELRWIVIQNILKIIPTNLKILWNKYGNEKIEFDQHFDFEEWPEKFCSCRILHESVYDELQTNIANDFIEERTRIAFPKLKTSQKTLVKEVLTNRNVDAETYDECMKIFEDYPGYQDVIFILSGLLKFEVLYLVLRKRWRVNYGINPNGYRKMAVPFIAKDVCAENTEFGHSDVAICFTYLSYYYSGLTDAQLLNCFDILSKLSNSDEKYKEWIAIVPNHRLHQSIHKLSGVNLSDSSQRIMLFTLLRYNINVIDFWLSNIVFPREAKQFDSKMMCTAWDLCSEENHNVITGFSGTNDTKLLLPKPICQNDLEELEDTNENVRKIIIQDENDNYVHLQANISGLHILMKLVDYRIPVLLDSGALMLELNNEQVAKKWLELVAINRFDAAVYFNDKNILMVVDRQNRRREFDFSPYFDRLDRCLVYLDDAHTRGTDLKFPTGTQACVTLSGSQTRDKTVQACMRMRLLGQGHTISFWASEEADNGIRELCEKKKPDPIFTKDVFNWICNNSRVFENDGLVHWSAAAYNYSQKLAAYLYIHEEITAQSSNDDEDINLLLEQLSDRCTDKEIIKLSDLYGGKNELSVVSIFKQRFSNLVTRSMLLLYNGEAEIETFLKSNSDFVLETLQKYIPNVTRFSQLLDEEQEKELEYELEEQREVQRPSKAYPAEPKLNGELNDFLTHGLKDLKYFNQLINKKRIMNVPMALQNTNLWTDANNNEKKWGNDIYVTADFMNVVVTQSDKADEFLRPVWWMVSANSSDPTNNQVLILMSPYEVNNFLPIFRENASTTLHMYSPRLNPDPYVNTMFNCKALQVPFHPHSMNIGGLIESQLSVFAGTIYFENKLEQENYCTFLGIIPSPFSQKYQKAFDRGQITFNGFVPPRFQNICKKIEKNCPFSKNPDKLVRGIIERRHGFLPKNSHVSKIVIEGTIAGIKYGKES